MFNDNKTFVELEDQDYPSHKDYDTYAIILRITVDKNQHSKIMHNKNSYPVADMELNYD